MAQCRKLEKLVQSQEQILLIKNLKKNSTNMCKPSMAIYSNFSTKPQQKCHVIPLQFVMQYNLSFKAGYQKFFI